MTRRHRGPRGASVQEACKAWAQVVPCPDHRHRPSRYTRVPPTSTTHRQPSPLPRIAQPSISISNSPPTTWIITPLLATSTTTTSATTSRRTTTTRATQLTGRSLSKSAEISERRVCHPRVRQRSGESANYGYYVVVVYLFFILIGICCINKIGRLFQQRCFFFLLSGHWWWF